MGDITMEYDTQITLDNLFQDYLCKASEDIQADIEQIEQDDADRCDRLKQIKTNIITLSKAPKRKKAVKSVINKLGDKGGRDDFSYYAEGMQELLNILHLNTEVTENVSLLPSVRTYKPTDLNILSAKLVSCIFSNDERTREAMRKGIAATNICNSIRGRPCKRKISNIKCVQLLNNQELLSDLTAFDKNVFFGICTLCEKAAEDGQTTNIIMTAGQIYQAFTGREAKQTEVLNKIAAIVDKLATYRIEFNWLEHAQLNGLANNDISDKKKARYILKDNLIHVQTVSCIVNGRAVDHAFKLLAIPILYKYAKDVRQIVTIDQEVLQIPKLLNTDDIIVIKNYLAYRIELMKNNKNRVKSDKILFETVYNECQIEFKSNVKVERKRKRDTICKILDYWVTTKYISWYEIIKENGKYTGVQITL